MDGCPYLVRQQLKVFASGELRRCHSVAGAKHLWPHDVALREDAMWAVFVIHHKVGCDVLDDAGHDTR